MNWMLWDGTGAELAAHMQSEREQHLVVISQRTDSETLNLDAQYVADRLDGWAEVIVLRNTSTAYELSDILPEDWRVFGDSARAYPADASLEAGRPSRYIVARAAGQLRKAADELIDLVEAMPLPPAAAATQNVRPVPSAESVRQDALVAGFLGSGERALVDLPDGSRAIVRQEDVVPDVRLDWLMAPGRNVSGVLNPETRILDLSAEVHIPRVGQAYQWGSVVLCLVESVEAGSAKLALVPGDNISVPVADISSNPLDQADELLTVGQVVAARLLLDAGRRRLSLIDVDDEETPMPAPTLVNGGTPWLELGRNLLPPSPDELAESEAEPSLVTPGQGHVLPGAIEAKSRPALKEVLLQLEAARAEIRSLRKDLQNNDDGSQSREELRTELDELREGLRKDTATIHELRLEARRKTELLMKAQDRARGAERRLDRAERIDAEFSSQDELFRHELYLAWVARVSAAEKQRFPLQKFTIGPKFLESFFSHSIEHRQKALKALVDLLTGRAAGIQSRQIHQLRTGVGGDDGSVIRPSDRARCMRMSVETKSSAARRIHYWDIPGGQVELHELVPHDVTDP